MGRHDLRAVEDCPRALQPLAELQYRGVIWTHRNGRDWTVAGFLQAIEVDATGDVVVERDLYGVGAPGLSAVIGIPLR